MQFDELKNQKIMVTGATGLIGKALVKKLVSIGAEVLVAVRSQEKAKSIFGDISSIKYICSDIVDFPLENMECKYIVHTASQTASKEFVTHPVETINTAIGGTLKILEFARLNPIKSMVYLSTMEVYGTLNMDNLINENNSTNINTMNVRSCYPESKRMCENICTSYFSEFNVPVKVVRLTQTFGPGVTYNDGRVFAEFARCAIEGRDIILKTKGETKRDYLYIDDAVDAILYVMLYGNNGEAYNAANNETYCSIYEMAQLVANKLSKMKIGVVIDEINNIEKCGYAPTLHVHLDTTKIQKLGWKPKVSLNEMYEKMISDMKESISNN